MTPDTQTTRLSGVGIIRNITQYHDVLCEALGAGADVVLDLEDMEEADLAFIQLIISARRSAQDRGLSLTLSRSAPEPILQTLERGVSSARPPTIVVNSGLRSKGAFHAVDSYRR